MIDSQAHIVAQSCFNFMIRIQIEWQATLSCTALVWLSYSQCNEGRCTCLSIALQSWVSCSRLDLSLDPRQPALVLAWYVHVRLLDSTLLSPCSTSLTLFVFRILPHDPFAGSLGTTTGCKQLFGLDHQHGGISGSARTRAVYELELPTGDKRQ